MRSLIPTRKEWSTWSKPSRITTISCFVGVLGVLITIILCVISTSIFNIETKTIINQGQNSTVNFYQGNTPEPIKPLKQRIRDMLLSINPDLIEKLDAGVPQIAVMINQTKIQDFIRLTKEPTSSGYIKIESDHSVIIGGEHNTIGGHLNDIDDTGTLHGYRLVFHDALRESTANQSLK